MITWVKHWARVLLPVVGLAGMVMGVYWAYLLMTSPTAHPFKTVKIIADANYLSPEDLKKTIQLGIDGGFFSFHPEVLKQQLKSLPWVKAVTVRRVWPQTLRVTVEEHQPLARWGRNGVLSREGEIFFPEKARIPKDLPRFEGPDHQAALMLSEYQTLSADLAPLHLNIRALTLTSRHAWQMVLSNGVRVMLGRQHINERVAQFVRVYPRIAATKPIPMASVDLRYPNGLAVQFGTPSSD